MLEKTSAEFTTMVLRAVMSLKKERGTRNEGIDSHNIFYIAYSGCVVGYKDHGNTGSVFLFDTAVRHSFY